MIIGMVITINELGEAEMDRDSKRSDVIRKEVVKKDVKYKMLTERMKSPPLTKLKDSAGEAEYVVNTPTMIYEGKPPDGVCARATVGDNIEGLMVPSSMRLQSLVNSAAILGEVSLLMREEVESKMWEYGADGLDDCNRNFDHLINILSSLKNGFKTAQLRQQRSNFEETCAKICITKMKKGLMFPKHLESREK